MPDLPGVSRIILAADETFPRYSEGDVVQLTDGRLLLAVGRKAGASDFAAGEIIGMFSSDGGATWDDEPHLIKQPLDGLVDLMSTSFCRSPRGLHLFFLGRGKDAKGDTQPYQMLSTDEGNTWGEPQRITLRGGYYVVNNARVIRTSKGRLLVPAAYVERIDKDYDGQSTLVLYSDDDGLTWRESNVLSLDGKPLMEPGVAECADGSVYMTIRTAVGVLYEARSRDGGATWGEFGPTKLPSPAAPSTVVRAPDSDELWMFWCNNAKADWKKRSPQVFASSRDHGKTWSEPRVIQHHPNHSYGYISFTRVKSQALLTYYDWPDNGQRGFHMTSLRQRTIPLAWLRGKLVPPVFRKRREPVLKQDGPSGAKLFSMNDGLLVEEDRWRLWYSAGQTTRVDYAESRDKGLTWEKGQPPALVNDGGHVYHACVQRVEGAIVLYAWRVGPNDENGLYRHVSRDDGKTFLIEPPRPLFVATDASHKHKALTGDDHVSTEAFVVLRNPAGSYDYFAAVVTERDDRRGRFVQHDSFPGRTRTIGRATSRDGMDWSPLEIVLRPSYDDGDAFDAQLYGMHVFRHRGFHLGLLFVFHAQSQTVEPQWAWSHNGQNWTRTRTPCIALGDEGSFDSRMILLGDVVMTDKELIWLYSGYDWRHNALRKGEAGCSIGRAVLPLEELDRWLDSLPQP